jgi:hypothetical protein
MSFENLREKKPSNSESSSPRQSITNLVTRLVGRDWLNRVDNIVGYNAFISAAQRQWRSLDQDGTGRVSFDAFVKGLQQSLAELWNEDLRPAAEALHGKAQDIFASDTRSSELESPTSDQEDSERKSSLLQFKDLWQAKIIALGKQQVISPGLVIFNRALNYYLDAKNRLGSSKEFVEGMRLHLGHLWDDKLDQPLREFYNGAKQAAREDLIQLRTQLQAHILSAKVDVRNKATIRSKVSKTTAGLIDFVLGIFTSLVRIVFPTYRVAAKQEHTQEQEQEQEEQEQEEQEQKEQEEQEEPKVHNTALSRAAKRAQALCDWGVVKAEQSLPPRVFAVGKDVYTQTEEVMKPHLNFLIEKLKPHLQQLDSRFLLTERLEIAGQGAEPLINRGLRYIKTTRKFNIVKDYLFFVYDLRAFMFQVVGLSSPHSCHFDFLAMELHQLFTNVIYLRGTNKHEQDDTPQSSGFRSRQAGES